MTESFEPEPEPDTAESSAEAVEPPSTGHPRIDEALSRLDGLDDLEITEHPDEFDAIHRVLRESLASAGRDGDAPASP
jgi:hypothetical protein